MLFRSKACGEPLCVIVHNVVGLLHAVMGIYYAYVDRAPVFVVGATGPMDEGKRRPRVDWDHTANVQGNAVRDFVKWDYQPGGIEGVPDSFARAYSIMMSEPQGPIYMCYDAGIQEASTEGVADRFKRHEPKVTGQEGQRRVTSERHDGIGEATPHRDRSASSNSANAWASRSSVRGR